MDTDDAVVNSDGPVRGRSRTHSFRYVRVDEADDVS